MQKKENAKIREEIDFYEKIIQEKGDDPGDMDAQSQMPFNHSKMSKGVMSHQSTLKKSAGYPGQQNQTRIGMMSRGTNRSISNANQPPPLVYAPPQKKQESEEEKLRRYERVIDKLKKMLDHERKQLRAARS